MTESNTSSGPAAPRPFTGKEFLESLRGSREVWIYRGRLKRIRIAHRRDVRRTKAVLAVPRAVFAAPVAFRTVEQDQGARPIASPERIEPQSRHARCVLLSRTEGAR